MVSTPWDTFVPLVGFDPDQSPEAVQDEGELVTLQVRLGLMELTVPEVGLAEIVTTGTGVAAEVVVNATSAPYAVPALLVA